MAVYLPSSLPGWTLFVVVDEKDLAETVDVSTESFVEYLFRHISSLWLSEDGEGRIKSSSKYEISKIAHFPLKIKDLTLNLKLKEAFRTEPRPEFLFCLKQSLDL